MYTDIGMEDIHNHGLNGTYYWYADPTIQYGLSGLNGFRKHG